MGQFRLACREAKFAQVCLLVMGLRVTREVEIEGLDLNLHGEVVP